MMQSVPAVPARGLAALFLALVTAAALLVVPTAPAAAVTADPWLDTAFSGDGTARTAYTGALEGTVVDAEKAPGGDLVVLLEPAHTVWGCCSAEVGAWSLARLAPDGTLRAGFGSGGVIQPALSALGTSVAGMRPEGLAIDAAGRLVVLGGMKVGGADRSVVVRFTSAGVLDPSFGTKGVALLGTAAGCHASRYPWFGGLVVTSAQRILIAGSCSAVSGSGSYFRAVLARLGSNGAPDVSYGAGGVRTLSMGTVGACCGVDIARTPDGRFLLSMGSGDASYLRLLATGEPDTTFGGDGLVVVPPDGGGDAVALGDGSVVWTFNGYYLRRLTPGGAPDASYGDLDSPGRAKLPLPPDCAYPSVTAMTRVGAGAMLLLTCVQGNVLMRLDAVGAVDTGFGIVPTAAAQGDADDIFANRRTLVADGTGVLVLGSDRDGGILVERRTAAGALDPAYGDDGVARLDLRGRWFSLDEVAAGHDGLGRLVTVAEVDNRGMGDEGALAVTRFRADGTPDPAFGTAGTAVVEAGGLRPWRFSSAGESISGLDVHVLTDGRVRIVALWENDVRYGAFFGQDERALFVAGLTAAGAPDPSVGPAGRRLLPLPQHDLSEVGGVAPGPAGTTLVAFTHSTPAGDGVALARLTVAGGLDAGFGSDGVLTLPDTQVASGYPDMRLLPAGPSWVLMSWQGYSPTFDDEIVMARISRDGVLDAAFGTSGRLRVAGERYEVAATASGKPLLAQLITDPDDDWRSSSTVRVRRYLASGAADTGFGRGGSAVVPSASTSTAAAYDRLVTIAADGERPLLVMQRRRGSVTATELLRLTASGALDSAFGTASVVRLDAAKQNVIGIRPRVLVGATGRTDVVRSSWGPRSGSTQDVLVTRVRAGVVRLAALPQFSTRTTSSLGWPGSVSGPYRTEARRAPLRGGFGPWTTVATPATTSGALATPRGTTTCARVRAADGQVSVVRCVAVPLPATSMSASNRWRTVRSGAYYAGSGRSSRTFGASLALAGVTAQRLAVVAERCPTCGVVDVLWNGTRMARLSFVGPPRHAVVHPLPAFAADRTGTLALRVVSRRGTVTVSGVAGWRQGG